MQAAVSLDPAAPKPVFYQHLCERLEQLLGDEKNLVANAANTSALLFHLLPDVNWVGFYMVEGRELVLGPFQGNPARVRIPFGKGVCGAAAADRCTMLVSDVSAFPGRVVSDPASCSEIAVPLLNWGNLLGVLEIDSASVNRFDADDRDGIECLVSVFVASQATNDLPDLSEHAVG